MNSDCDESSSGEASGPEGIAKTATVIVHWPIEPFNGDEPCAVNEVRWRVQTGSGPGTRTGPGPGKRTFLRGRWLRQTFQAGRGRP